VKLTRALAISTAVWAVGVQLNELIAAIGCYATTLLVLLVRRPTLADVRRWWPLAAFIGWGLCVPVLGGKLPTGAGVARLCDWLLLPVAAVAVTQLGDVARRRVLIAAGSVAVLSCIAAGFQHFGLWPSEETMAALLGWTKIPYSRVYEPVPDSDGRFMAGGLAFHRLKFAEVTALVVLAAAALRRPVAFAVAALGFVSVLVFPAARASAGALVLSLAGTARPRWLAAVLVIAAVGLVALTPGLRERFLSSVTAKGSGERTGMLQAGLDAVIAHPLTGVGLGRFKPALFAREDSAPEVFENAGKAHNQFLSVAAEGGVPHAVLFVVLLGWIGLLLFRSKKGPLTPSLSPTRGEGARIAGLAAIFFFTLLCLAHDPMFHAVMVQAVALLLGGCLALAVGQQEPDEREAQLRSPLQVQAPGDARPQEPGGA